MVVPCALRCAESSDEAKQSQQLRPSEERRGKGMRRRPACRWAFARPRSTPPPRHGRKWRGLARLGPYRPSQARGGRRGIFVVEIVKPCGILNHMVAID